MQIKYHFYHRSSSNGMMMMIRSIWLINRYKHLRGNKKRQKILNRNSYYRPHNNLLSSQCLLLPSIFFPCHPPMLQYFFSPILGSVAFIVCLLHHYCHACILLSLSIHTKESFIVKNEKSYNIIASRNTPKVKWWQKNRLHGKKLRRKKSENFSFRFFLCLPKCGEFLAFYVEDFFDE